MSITYHNRHKRPPTFDVRLFDDHSNPLADVEVHAFSNGVPALDSFSKAYHQAILTRADGRATFACGPLYHFVAFECHGRKFGPFPVDAGDTIGLVL